MPTVFRFDGMRVAIYPNDHPPAHVHVISSDAEAVYDLNCLEGPPVLRGSFRFKTRDLTRIAAALAASLRTLCEEWDLIHGSHARR
jgi:hypothetical protein